MANHDIVAIGGSYGSYEVVRETCRALPADLPACVFVVIHIAAFRKNFLADLVGLRSALPVRTASEGEAVAPGHVYVAPADRHLLVIDGTIRLGHGPRENMARPAIDPLFRSLAMSYGPRVVAAILTGFLDDGAAGLADVKSCGGVSVVQNPSDAASDEMPRSALRASDVDYRTSAHDLPRLLCSLVASEAGARSHVPESLRLEVEIALGRPTDHETMSLIGAPAALTCPACNGVLSEMIKGPPLRFRCQVGHAFTAETLAVEQESAVDEALRVALRIIGERALLTKRMADDARRNGLPAAAASYESRCEEYRRSMHTLQRATLVRELTKKQPDDTPDDSARADDKSARAKMG